ncbi:DUF4922 domain-containing protein [bacterium]|nr:DUF4922 domain-containing protein [bacterium]MBU1635810.1 DUF4922 domain-containing protein [bacterium]MBU1874851.1 DUF4922 domain-containing protein [bacterium]
MSLTEHHLNDSELELFFADQSNIDDNSRAAALIKQQSDRVNGWPRLIRNLDTYSRIQKDVVNVKGIDIVVTLNETRAPSITAKTFESKQLNSQPCILCNLDAEQKGILTLENRFIVLANPGITIPGDLTIASVNHDPQLIANSFEDMVSLSKTLTDYSIFYNGAMAGASSPHFHFQAGLKNTLIAEQQIDQLLNGSPVGNAEIILLHENKTGRLFFLNNYLRAAYLVVSSDYQVINRLFREFYLHLKQVDRFIKDIPNVPDFGARIISMNINETEPRMNLMLKYIQETAKYLLVIFPKVFNRPAAYFKTGTEQLIVGMAIKESLGNLITVREADYEHLKTDPSLITKIYSDTSIPPEMIEELNKSLKMK